MRARPGPAGWLQKMVFATDKARVDRGSQSLRLCVVELFHTALHGPSYCRGRHGRAAKGPAVGALLVLEEPEALLAEHAQTQDAAWSATADGMQEVSARDVIRVLQHDARSTDRGKPSLTGRGSSKRFTF